MPARAKLPRHGRVSAATPSSHPSASRIGGKEKQLKPHGAKTTSVAAAAKAGGQRPLPPETRQLLDAKVAGMLLRQPALEGLGGRGARAVGPAVGPMVLVTGFYLGHPIVRPTVDSIAGKLRSQPLAPDVTLTSVHPGSEHTLIVLTAPGCAAAAPTAPVADSTASAPVATTEDAGKVQAATAATASDASPAAAAAVGSGSAPGAGSGAEPACPCTTAPSSSSSPPTAHQPPPCMAIMLLEYGGVAFFNVPEQLMLAALARVTAAVLPQAQQAGLQLPRRQASGAELEAWRAVAAEKLHREEQLFVVDRALFSTSPKKQRRWIRKTDDALHIWEWDSINLETAACVITQSAAIRYYNQECEAMCERYETIMPLAAAAGDSSVQRSVLRRALGGLGRWVPWRRRLPLHDLQQMVFECSGINVRLYSRLGLREPPPSTWESARHHAVWDAMRHEFELDERRDTLMEKSDLLKQSCLDLISATNDSFTRLSEIMIIALISMEIFITLTGLHGVLGIGAAGQHLTPTPTPDA